MASGRGPSTSLRRAARKEMERIDRSRERLRERLRKLRDEAAEVEEAMAELDERADLLTALTGDQSAPEDAAPTGGDGPTEGGREVLKGAAIRERAARRYFLTHGAGKAMHYRHWFDLLLREEAVEIPGQDPAATFLTNLGRSPVVVRGEGPGVYAIDAEAPARLRSDLAESVAELRDVTEVIARDPGRPGLREHRDELISRVRQLEGLIAETERVLAPVDAEGGEDAPLARAA